MYKNLPSHKKRRKKEEETKVNACYFLQLMQFGTFNNKRHGQFRAENSNYVHLALCIKKRNL